MQSSVWLPARAKCATCDGNIEGAAECSDVLVRRRAFAPLDFLGVTWQDNLGWGSSCAGGQAISETSRTDASAFSLRRSLNIRSADASARVARTVRS